MTDRQADEIYPILPHSDTGRPLCAQLEELIPISASAWTDFQNMLQMDHVLCHPTRLKLVPIPRPVSLLVVENDTRWNHFGPEQS